MRIHYARYELNYKIAVQIFVYVKNHRGTNTNRFKRYTFYSELIFENG